MPAGDRPGTQALQPEQAVAPEQVGRTAAGWSLLLPDTWHHIPLDPTRHRRVTAMLRDLFAALPRDAIFPWRHELEQQINTLLDEALEAGGSDVYLLVDPRYGLPLAATCLASLIPTRLPTDIPAEILARTLAEHADDRTGVMLVQGQECAAVRRTEPAKTEDAAAPIRNPSEPGTAAVPAALTVVCLDVYIPFPGSARTLLLTFRTPVAAVADPMVTLFEAITQSLRWTWEPEGNVGEPESGQQGGET
jgi:hypothetical protein